MRAQILCPCGAPFTPRQWATVHCDACRNQKRRRNQAEARRKHYHQVIKGDPDKLAAHREGAARRMAEMRARRREEDAPTRRALAQAEEAKGAWELVR